MKKKIMFTLTIFVLVFGVAAYLKTQAGVGENSTGWLWGGGTGVPGDGTHTNVRWISMNCTDREAATGKTCLDKNNPAFNLAVNLANYGVNIPANGIVTGYAWSGGDESGPGLGWIDLEPQSHCVTGVPSGDQYKAASCTPPSGSAGVTRTGDNLTGWARIVEIAKESVTGNSGGWTGWIHMSGTNYGVSINADGTFCKAGDPKTVELNNDGKRHCFASAGDDELGWIDFNRAQTAVSASDVLKICMDSCNSGSLVANNSSRTMTVGDSLDLKACFNTSASCDMAMGDVTSSTTWNENNTPNNAVSLSGTNPKTLTANISGSEGISASYNFQTSDFTVTVAPLCVCNTGCEASTCTGTNCNNSCGNSVCPGTKNCDTGWIEVAP